MLFPKTASSVTLFCMDRTCKDCGKEQAAEKFAKAGIVKGVQYYRHLCVQCYSASKRPRKQAIRDWWYAYKKTQQCEHCGNDDFRVLVFHHTGNKEFNLGLATNRGFSKEKIMAEVAKCIPLCGNCHMILHYEEHNGT